MLMKTKPWVESCSGARK